MKYLLFILFLSCTPQQEELYSPQVTTFVGKDLEFFNAVNEIRLSRNIAVLKGEKLLVEGCVQHANYLSSIDSLNHDYFWVRYVNSKSKTFGEVLSYGYITVQSQISGYSNSPKHYEVLINPNYTHIGIANKGLYQVVNLASYR